MTTIRPLAILIACMMLTLAAGAQKFGYINSQELIQQIPQVKEANAQLETSKQQYEKLGQDKVAALQTKYAALERKQAQGEIAPKQLEVYLSLSVTRFKRLSMQLLRITVTLISSIKAWVSYSTLTKRQT